jgi:hypothetical protein
MRNDLVLIPLQERIKDDDPGLLDIKISEFSCSKDLDVESFLKERSIRYERTGLSRTYLYIIRGLAKVSIAAYFSVAITSTDFEGISRSRRAKVLGGKPGRNTKDHFGGILIAQLARSDSFDPSDINGREMILDAEKVIEHGRRYLGGKIVYLDCREPLIDFYRGNGYELVSNEVYFNGLYKMFKALPEL